MSIKNTYYQNPSVDDQKTRVEFSIKQSGILKNFRLINFGVNTYTVPEGDNNSRSYPALCGAYSLIDTISLISEIDGSLISEVRNVGDYMAFKLLTDSQEENTNINNSLFLNQLGYNIYLDGQTVKTTATGKNLTVSNTFAYIDLQKILPVLYGLDRDTYNSLIKEKDKSKVRKILRDSGGILGDLKLKLVIEYTDLLTTPSKLFINGTDQDVVTLASPVLAFDIYPSQVKNSEIVYDDIIIENISTNVAQWNGQGDSKRKYDYYLKGCMHRKVRDITMAIKPLSCDGTFRVNTKTFCSVGLFNELTNFTLNNELVFQNNAITSTTMKAGYLDFSKRNTTCPILYENRCHLAVTANNSPLMNDAGNLSYLSFYSNDETPIEASQLSHEYNAFKTDADINNCDSALLGNFQYIIMYTSKRMLVYKDGEILIANA